MEAGAFVLASRELVLLLGGAVLLVGVAFVAARVLRALEHGFSVRLQLFFAVLVPSLLATAMIGAWAVERVYSRADALMADEPSKETLAVVAELVRDFGPKTTVLFALLACAAAGAAFALGRGLARPLEQLARSAEAIARGERHAVLPPPRGREVRRLTAAFESMRRSLEDRHHIEQFVADLGHELKNPVSAIRAATEVLLEGAAEDPVARPRFLGRIDEATRRLEGLLQDLLGLARLEARGLEPGRHPLGLHAIAAEAVRAATTLGAARGVRVVLDARPVELRGDRTWLRRAVDNLLDNAVRYSPDGGSVQVEVRAEGPEAVLRVRDEGPGVAPALRERLFARFVTDRAHVGGTGLGLAIVRSVAEQHGGSARLVEAGPGAVFELRLPLSVAGLRG